jgi:hypothetical protein
MFLSPIPPTPILREDSSWLLVIQEPIGNIVCRDPPAAVVTERTIVSLHSQTRTPNLSLQPIGIVRRPPHVYSKLVRFRRNGPED